MSLEASTTKVENGPARSPGRMMAWLDFNYKKEVSKNPFVATLKNWIRYIYGPDSVGNYRGNTYGLKPTIVKRNVEKRINEIEAGLTRYFSDLENRDFLTDYKGFIHWLQNEGYANLTIRLRCSKAKVFFGRQDPRCKIDDEDWSQIKRTLLPKSTRASTQDDILTKEQLKRVLQHSDVHGRALALFLLSTGARIGESCKLKMEDIDLYSDPPQVHIREKYTKGEVGGRVMWFSEEARDAIIEWHKSRIGRKKKGGHGYFLIDDEEGPGPKDLVFNYTETTFNVHWNASLARADKGQNPPVLAKRDPSTKKRIHVFHVHTLRKFFRTNMGFKGSHEGNSGVPDVIVHGWMGHKGYLEEAYARGPELLSEIYKENMHVVTVQEVGLDEKTRAEIKEAIERAEILAKQVTVDGAYIDMVGDQLGAFVGLSADVIEAMSGKAKWTLIINKAAQLKADAARSSKEMDKVTNQLSIMTNEGE